MSLQVNITEFDKKLQCNNYVSTIKKYVIAQSFSIPQICVIKDRYLATILKNVSPQTSFKDLYWGSGLNKALYPLKLQRLILWYYMEPFSLMFVIVTEAS